MSYIGLNQPQAVVDPNSLAPEAYTGRNLLINGDFSVWQRGTSFSLGGYTADRIYIAADRELIRSTDVPNSLTVFSAEVTASAGKDPLIYTSVELSSEGLNAPFMRNTDYTVSCYVKGNAGSDISVRVQFVDKVGGAGAVPIVPMTVFDTATGGWQKVEYTFNTGNVIAGPANVAMEVILLVNSLTVPANFTQWQLEQGSVATEFEYVDPATQLAKCQRYGIPLVAGVSAAMRYTTTATIGGLLPTPVQLRADPTLEGTLDMRISGGGANQPVDQTDISLLRVRSNGIYTVINGLTTSSPDDSYVLYINAVVDAFLSAEL